MKKLFYLLLITVFFTAVLSSCRHSKPCAAYGESKYYQIEKPF